MKNLDHQSISAAGHEALSRWHVPIYLLYVICARRIRVFSSVQTTADRATNKIVQS